MTAVTQKIEWDFHLPPKADTCAKFQLSRLLGSLARECDAQTHRHTHRHTHRQTHARQVKIVLTLALLGWCQGLSSEIDDRFHELFFNGILIYPLKLITLPNFSSLG